MKIKDHLQKRAFSLSFEVFPPNQKTDLEALFETTDKLKALTPDFISVTYGALGGNTQKTFEIAKRLKDQQQHEALSHLTCIHSKRTQMLSALEHLKESGIENILALRGDCVASSPKGDFVYAEELIAFIKAAYGDTFSIGGACYPEGHIEAISKTQDILNLRSKTRSGLDFLVTQMFFDNEILYDYMERLTLAGIDTPLIAGVMPVINFKQIAKIIALSGCSLPLKFKRMLNQYEHAPDALREAGIAYASEQIIDLIAYGIKGVHLYTMNRFDTAERICSNINFARENRNIASL